MKMSCNYVIKNVGSEYFLSPVGKESNSIIILNETTAFILKCLSIDMSFDDLLNKLYAEYDVDYDVLKKDVEEILSELKLRRVVID